MPRTTKKATKVSKTVSKSSKKGIAVTSPVKKISFPKFNVSFLKEKYDGSKLFKVLVLTIFFVFSFALVDLFVQYLNNNYSVAIVNGVRISKGDYMTRLQKTYGLSTVSNLIQEELVLQGAAKEKVSVTDDEVQTRLNEYYNENGGKDAVLATLKQNNFTEEDVREQIRIGLMMEKALSPKITYTDKELEEFFDQYKSILYGEEKVKFADKKEEIKNYYVNKGVQDMKDGWLADLEKESKVQNNIETRPGYGFLKTTINIVTNLYNQIKTSTAK